MRLSPVVFVCILAGGAFASVTPEESLAVAKAALRDGLYDVARTHARQSGLDGAQDVIVEAYAREGDWDGVLANANDGYYRALALYRTGKADEARKLLAEADDDLSRALKARLALEAGDAKEAVALLKGIGSPDTEMKMLLAGALDKNGDRKAAEKIWRELLPDPHAAMNLGDVESLRRAYEETEDVSLRMATGLRLGRQLLNDANTKDEGEKLVSSIVHDAPDTDGAREAMLDLNEFYLVEEENEKALAGFSEMIEVWPESSKDYRIFAGRGWAYLRTGKTSDALSAFSKAVALASDDSEKALNLVKVGDCQSLLGRGDEAMATYRRVLTEFASTPSAVRIKETVKVRELEARGYEVYKDYKFEEAMAIFAQVAKEDPSRRQAMEYCRMLCLYGLGRDEEAEAAAIALDTPESRLWLAKFYYNAGRWSEACKLFGELDFPEATLWSARSALADNEFAQAIAAVARLNESGCDPAVLAAGMMVQGQALVELARFDEAVLVLERVALMPEIGSSDRNRALMMKADALFAMGADNPVRYEQSLETYRAVRMSGAELTPSQKLQISFKIGRILEKQHHTAEAMDQYYTQVCLAYRMGRERGEKFDDAAQAAFARAAFRLADEYEEQGQDRKARQILRMVVRSAVPASAEAEKRIEDNKRKGRFL